MGDTFKPLDPRAQLEYLLARVAERAFRSWSGAQQAQRINPRQFSMVACIATAPEIN